MAKFRLMSDHFSADNVVTSTLQCDGGSIEALTDGRNEGTDGTAPAPPVSGTSTRRRTPGRNRAEQSWGKPRRIFGHRYVKETTEH